MLAVAALQGCDLARSFRESGEAAQAPVAGAPVLAAAPAQALPAAVQNPAGIVSAQWPQGVQGGVVTVQFTHTDPASLPADFQVEWSVAGQPWKPATPAPGSKGLAALASSPTGVSHSFQWDAAADLPGRYENDVRLRVRSPQMASPTPPFPVNTMKSPPAALSRQPWLQSVLGDSAIVLWRTGSNTADNRVEYGTSPELGSVANGTGSGKDHELSLAGLEPGTRYYYRVVSNGKALSSGDSFLTAPAAAVDFDFGAIGDSGEGGQDQYDLARKLVELDPELLLHVGDVVYPRGEKDDYQAKFFDPYQDYLRKHAIWPTLGNHDVYNAGALIGKPDYLGIFALPRNNPQSSERWYSFDWGDVHFAALDTSWTYNTFGLNLSQASDQVAWLEKDLAGSSKTWKIVFFHVAPYTSGKHGKDMGTKQVRDIFCPVFDRNYVDLVIAGHDHHYERTKPIHTVQGIQHREGPTYIVTGGGGRRLRAASATAITESIAVEFHLTHFQVRGRNITLTAYKADGTVIDQHTLSK